MNYVIHGGCGCPGRPDCPGDGQVQRGGGAAGHRARLHPHRPGGGRGGQRQLQVDIYISTDTSTHNHAYLQISTNIYTQLYIQVPGGGRELLQPGDGGAGGGGHPAPLHPGRGHGGGGGGGGGGSTPWTLLGTALPCDHLHATVRSATMNKYLSHRLVFVFLPPSLLCHIVMTP